MVGGLVRLGMAQSPWARQEIGYDAFKPSSAHAEHVRKRIRQAPAQRQAHAAGIQLGQNHAIDVDAACKPRNIEAGRRHGLRPCLLQRQSEQRQIPDAQHEADSGHGCARARACSRRARRPAHRNPKPTGRAGRHAHEYRRRTADIGASIRTLARRSGCRKSGGMRTTRRPARDFCFVQSLAAPISILRRALVSAIHSPAVLALIPSFSAIDVVPMPGARGHPSMCRRNASRFLGSGILFSSR